jgi:hypothetical protein
VIAALALALTMAPAADADRAPAPAPAALAVRQAPAAPQQPCPDRTKTETKTKAKTTRDPGPEVTILVSTPVLTSPDDEVTVTFQVSNTTGKTWSGDINLALACDPFRDQADLAAWPSQDLTDLGELTWPVIGESKRLEAGEVQTYSLSAAARDMNLGARGDEPGWGPRGLAVILETSRGAVAATTTYLVYAPPEKVTSSLNLSLTVGLTAAPGEDRETTLSRLTRVIAASRDPWISWLLDPSLLVSSQGEEDPQVQLLAESITEAIDQGKAVYLLPYQDLDQVALAAAGDKAQAVLTGAKRIGEVALVGAVDELVASRVGTNLAWVGQPVDRSALDFMAAGGASAVLLAPDQLAGAVPQAAISHGGLVAVATDQSLTEALTGANTPGTDNRLLAETALRAQRGQVDGYQGSAVAAFDRSWDPGTSSSDPLMTLLATSWVRPTPLAAIINEPVEGDLNLSMAHAHPGPPLDSLSQLVDLTERAAAFAALTPKPDAYLARALPPLLAPLSNSVSPGSRRAAAATLALKQAATDVPPVSVRPGSNVNMISDEGGVPVTVLNNSNEPISGLVVDLKSQTNAIQIGEPVELDLAPAQEVTARVPVHAVANGVFEVKVDLLDPAGQPVAEGASLTLRVRAEWENVGTAIAGAVLVLIIALGLFMTVRKRRAAARTRLAETSSQDGPSVDSAGSSPTEPLA